MFDQKNKFTPLGLATEIVGDPSVLQRALDGKYQLLYVSPESLVQNPSWREMLHSEVYRERLIACVVDEVHCVKKW